MSSKPSAHAADILVVDDAPANLQLLFGMLKERGYRVRPVASGRIALGVAKARPPDLVLLDVNMPDMNGYEVCRKLKEDPDLASIPVLFISALSESFDKLEAFSAGGVDYITKPFHLDEVRARIETHLALRRLQAKLEAQNHALEEANDRLRKLESVRKVLSAAIVHDLKSPLAALIGSAQFLLRLPSVVGEVREVVGDVLASSDGMHRMILNLLDIARMEDAALLPQRRVVPIASLLDRVRATAQLHMRLTSHQVAIDAGGVREVNVDPDLALRVIENIIDNSLKYAPRGGTIRVSTAPRDRGGLFVRVEDDGPGVPADQRDRIFERYARLDRDAQYHARSSRGLGLSFCRLAVEAHGGKIWVEDGAAGGAAFCFEIPGPAA